MNKTILIGKWNKFKGVTKQCIGVIMCYNHLSMEGKKDKKLGRLQIKIGNSQEELLKVFPLLKHNSSLVQLHTSIKY